MKLEVGFEISLVLAQVAEIVILWRDSRVLRVVRATPVSSDVFL